MLVDVATACVRKLPRFVFVDPKFAELVVIPDENWAVIEVTVLLTAAMLMFVAL